MSSLKSGNWVVKKAVLNAGCLSQTQNTLSVELGFSIKLPKDSSELTCSVGSKINAKIESGDDFLTVNLLSDFSFTDYEKASLSDDEKKVILKEEAFPEVYENLCNYVKAFLKISNLKEMTLPPYKAIKDSL